MERVFSTIIASLLGAAMYIPLAADSATLPNTFIFVAPGGNDATCNTQVNPAGSPVAPPIAPGTIPCKTFTHACAMLPKPAPNWVIQAEPAGTLTTDGYVEDVKCDAEGLDPDNFVSIIGASSGHAPAYLRAATCAPGSAAWEHFGRGYVYFNKFVITRSCQDGMYIHGKNSLSRITDFVIQYNTQISNNHGYGVHVDYGFWPLMERAVVFNNGDNPSAESCVLIESSTFALVNQTGIWNCGSVTSVPKAPKPGVIFRQNIYPQYYQNRELDGTSVSVVLDDTFIALLARDLTKPVQQPFTYRIKCNHPSECAYQLSGDTIINGTQVP